MKKAFLITLLAAGMTVTMTSGTVAQEREGGMGSGMMQGDMPSGMMGRMQRSEGGNRSGGTQGNMCSGMTMGSGMTCPCMMEGGMCSGSMSSGTMNRAMPHGMMGSDTMHSGMGSGKMGGDGMMGSGMMRDGTTGMPFGSRVVPTMNLSVDDVRNYLSSRLDRLHNKRLKLGDVKTDDSTITADVVTVDNSLVQRLKINRRTGEIEYED
jgi:hypothetical protein